MYKVESSVVINAPVEEVYDWVEHPEKHHAWQQSLIESRRTDDGKVIVARKFLGRRHLVARSPEEARRLLPEPIPII